MAKSRINGFAKFRGLGVALLFSASLIGGPNNLHAADQGIMDSNDAVVSGFSGIKPAPDGSGDLDKTFIDVDGASLKIFDLSGATKPLEGNLLDAPVKFSAPASKIGQVFGIALDDLDNPNIYATATSMMGLQIVTPDGDGDGMADRIRTGRPNAQWMSGQFGQNLGGGPGSVWKIDGVTGEITLFANVELDGTPNSGAGLGNIAFDKSRNQLFVSDMDTGMIHRFDMAGTDLDRFDHGQNGRPNKGLDAVAHDPANRADISGPGFDAEDPESWGLADARRRVGGLAVHGSRLYYAVRDPLQIWSVGINQDGSFAGDARWELDVDAVRNHPVTDIVFDKNHRIILAQRGNIKSSYDYSQYHKPRNNQLLRYTLESPDDPVTESRWTLEPQEYAQGFAASHRNTSGGVAISCQPLLWSTGDALRDNPDFEDRLRRGGALVVHGLQGNYLKDVRPENVPPWKTHFTDFDGQFDDPQHSGWVGDVEFPRCKAKKKVDLRILKKATSTKCVPGGDCHFLIEVENVSSVPYKGPVTIAEVSAGGATLVDYTPKADWDCKQAGPGFYQCKHGDVTLLPNQKLTLQVTFHLAQGWDWNVYKNCARIAYPGREIDGNRYNNEACDYVPTCVPGTPYCAPDLKLEKYGLDRCTDDNQCEYRVRITNVGAVPFTGPLHVHDALQNPGATLTNWETKPQWNCIAGGAGSYDCHRTPITLTPGDYEELTLTAHVPPVAGIYTAKNCAWIKWGATPRDYNKANEYQCAELPMCIPGDPNCKPDMEIEKTGDPICWDIGGGIKQCYFQISVGNVGAKDFNGPFTVQDKFVNGATLVNYGNNPPWSCVDTGGGTFKCDHPNTVVAPGDWLDPLWLVFNLPAGFDKKQAKNCAIIDWNGGTDGNAGNDEDCLTASVCDPWSEDCPLDLALEKTGDWHCLLGDQCWFDINVSNISSDPYVGNLVVKDLPQFNLPLVDYQVQPDWSCVPNGGTYTCTMPGALLNPGDNATLSLRFNIPNDYATNELKNCSKIDWNGSPDAIPGNDEDCHTAFITDWQERAADLPLPVKPLPNPVTPLPDPVSTQCDSGWTKFSNNRAVPNGWAKKWVGTGKNSILCAKKRFVSLSCPSGWTKFSSVGQVPRKGWTWKKIGSGSSAIICGQKRETQYCPDGWSAYPNRNAVPRGWKWNWFGKRPNRFICAKPREVTLSCPSGWKRYKSKYDVPKGYMTKWVRGGGKSILCGKKRYVEPVKCPSNQIYSYWAGKMQCHCPTSKPIWSKKKGKCVARVIIDPTPIYCSGGRYYNKHSKSCRCPSSKPIWNKKKGKCVARVVIDPTPIRCTGGRYYNKKVKACLCPIKKPIWSKKKGRCVKLKLDIPIIKFCSGGRKYNKRTKSCLCPSKRPIWRGGKCRKRPSHGNTITNPGGYTKPSVTKKTRPVSCPKYWRRVNGKCKPPKIRLPKTYQ